MTRASTVPDVEAMLLRSLQADRKHAKLHVEMRREGFDVIQTKTMIVNVSGLSYGRAIWLSERTGESTDAVIDRLGRELDLLEVEN